MNIKRLRTLIIAALLLGGCFSKEITPAHVGLVLHRAQTGPDTQTYVICTLSGRDISIRSASRDAMPGDCVSFEDGVIQRLDAAVNGKCRIE